MQLHGAGSCLPTTIGCRNFEDLDIIRVRDTFRLVGVVSGDTC